jgi:IS30 family transposase
VEVDLMMGANHKSALLVITDRATIKTRLRKLSGKNSSIIARKTIAALQSQQQPIRTLTFDNDMAFADHQLIAQSLNAFSFFTRPYTSQDKGTVENRIGVIRMFLPKKTDLNLIAHQTIRKIENKINNRPVRKFNYLTPNQLFSLKTKSCI